VLLIGPSPPREKLNITESGCHHAAGEEPVKESVVVNSDGTLRNTIVHIKAGLGDRVFAPPEAAVIDQKGCVYLPHVSAVQTNQLITFLNSDPTLHNIHAVAKVNSPFNVGMAIKGQKVTRFFSKPEIVRMKCDVHSWMLSYVGVFDNPFHAVTGDEGTFVLKGLPAGTYELEAWHETYGTRSQPLTLADGESKTLEFRFGE